MAGRVETRTRHLIGLPGILNSQTPVAASMLVRSDAQGTDVSFDGTHAGRHVRRGCLFAKYGKLALRSSCRNADMQFGKRGIAYGLAAICGRAALSKGRGEAEIALQRVDAQDINLYASQRKWDAPAVKRLRQFTGWQLERGSLSFL
jgi:hypothetical protein